VAVERPSSVLAARAEHAPLGEYRRRCGRGWPFPRVSDYPLGAAISSSFHGWRLRTNDAHVRKLGVRESLRKDCKVLWIRRGDRVLVVNRRDKIGQPGIAVGSVARCSAAIRRRALPLPLPFSPTLYGVHNVWKKAAPSRSRLGAAICAFSLTRVRCRQPSRAMADSGSRDRLW